MFSRRRTRLILFLSLTLTLLFGTLASSSAAPVMDDDSRVAGHNNNNRTLIRNAALVLPMDPALGSGLLGKLENAVVLFEGDTIVAVGHNLSSAGANVVDATGKIVMPGFVETHNHMWQSLVRGCESDEAFNGWADGCTRPLQQTGIVLREDAYAAVRLSTLDVIGTGTTTSVEFSHAPSIEFADGTLDALEDSGMRFVLAYRFRVGREAHVRDMVQNRINTNPLANVHIGGPVPAPSGAAIADLRASLAMARELGVMLNIHFLETSGDRASNPVGVLQTVGAFDNFHGRLLLDHAIHLTDAELDILAAKDARVAHNPLSNMRLASGIIRLPEMRARGLKVGLGYDGGTNDTSDMFNTMRTAVGLQRAKSLDAKIYPGVEDGLRMATLGGAEVLGMEDKIGSLTPGKKADVIIINPDTVNFAPKVDWLGQLVFNGQPRNVEWVFVNGRALMKKGQYVGVNPEKVTAEAEAAVDRINARLGR
jgi:5-methylthioadenosine/S-adenosylhomocysteine deaminase